MQAAAPFFFILALRPKLEIMADDAESEAFCKLLSSLRVPQALQHSLSELGIANIADYAYAYNSTADLSHFVAQLPDQLWQDLGVEDPEHCPATAKLRRALDKCKAMTQAADGIASTAASPSQRGPRKSQRRTFGPSTHLHA